MSLQAGAATPSIDKRIAPETCRGRGRVSQASLSPSIANAGTELAKAKLASAIVARIDALRLTQSQADSRMGIHQPRVSQIKCGRLGDFSIGTLLELALTLGIDVDIHVHQEQSEDVAGQMSVRGDFVIV